MYRYVKIQLRREWTHVWRSFILARSRQIGRSWTPWTSWTIWTPWTIWTFWNTWTIWTPWTSWTPWTIWTPILAIRQKHKKPLAVDARCLLRTIDVAAARKSSSKLGYFQPSPPSPFRVLASIARRETRINTRPLDGSLLRAWLPHARQNALFLFIALPRLVAFIKSKALICFWYGP